MNKTKKKLLHTILEKLEATGYSTGKPLRQIDTVLAGNACFQQVADLLSELDYPGSIINQLKTVLGGNLIADDIYKELERKNLLGSARTPDVTAICKRIIRAYVRQQQPTTKKGVEPVRPRLFGFGGGYIFVSPPPGNFLFRRHGDNVHAGSFGVPSNYIADDIDKVDDDVMASKLAGRIFGWDTPAAPVGLCGACGDLHEIKPPAKVGNFTFSSCPNQKDAVTPMKVKTFVGTCLPPVKYGYALLTCHNCGQSAHVKKADANWLWSVEPHLPSAEEIEWTVQHMRCEKKEKRDQAFSSAKAFLGCLALASVAHKEIKIIFSEDDTIPALMLAQNGDGEGSITLNVKRLREIAERFLHGGASTDVATAVHVLQEALREDSAFYETYQANLAMAFVDQASVNIGLGTVLLKEDLHAVANAAADRFLQNFLFEPEKGGE